MGFTENVVNKILGKTLKKDKKSKNIVGPATSSAPPAVLPNINEKSGNPSLWLKDQSEAQSSNLKKI